MIHMFQKREQLGASISDDSVELVQMRTDAQGRPVLTSFALAPLEKGIVEKGHVADPARLGALLARLLAAGTPVPFTAKDIVIALPESSTFFHRFTIAGDLADAELQSALEFQAEEAFPVPIKDMRDAVLVLERGNNAAIVLYAVAPRAAIDGYAAAVQTAGLKLAGVTLESLSLRRLFAPTNAKGKATILVDLGAHATNLTLTDALGLAGSFTRPEGGAHWTEAIASALKIPLEQAEAMKCTAGIANATAPATAALAPFLDRVADDLRTSADWYRDTTGGAVDACILTGGGSRMPGLAEALATRLAAREATMRVTVGDIGPAIPTAVRAKTLGLDGVLSPAIGAAMQGMDGDAQIIDFLRSGRIAAADTPEKAGGGPAVLLGFDIGSFLRRWGLILFAGVFLLLFGTFVLRLILS